MHESEEFSETEQLLLMAAAVEGLGANTDLGRANTVRVVDRALQWHGMSVEEIGRGWWDEPDWGRCHPLNEQFYRTLIRMVHHVDSARPPERPGPALFEGSGNWGIPGDPSDPACWPHFNSCRLTQRGESIARELMARHPQYR